MLRTKSQAIVLFIILSSFLLSNCNDKDGVKPDSNSNIIFYNETGTEAVRKVVSLNDGGFIYVGQANNKAFAMRISSNGDRLWYKSFGGGINAAFNDAQEKPDGEIVLVGYTSSAENSIGRRAGLVIAVNSTGEVTWQKTYPGATMREFYTLTVSNDASIIVAGYVATSDLDSWIMRIKSGGDIIWSRVHENISAWHDATTSILQGADGNYVISGYASPDASSVNNSKFLTYLHGIDASNGSLAWGGVFYQYPNRYYTKETEVPQAINYEDGFVFGTSQYDSDTVLHIQLVKTNNFGKNLLGKKYYGLGEAVFRNIQKTKDGGLLISGSTRELTAPLGSRQGFLLKVNSAGEEDWSSFTGGMSTEDYAMQSRSTSTGWNNAGYSTNSRGVNSLMFYKTNKTGEITD